MADDDDLPPDVDNLSDTDFKVASSAKKLRVTTPVSKDSQGTPKPSGTPVVSAMKTGKMGTAISSQEGEEVIESKTGKGYLKVSNNILVGCHGNFRKNFNIDKLGGKQKAIDAGHVWLASRQHQPEEKKTQSHKEPTKPLDKGISIKAEKGDKAKKGDVAADKKKRKRDKPDPDTVAKQKEQNNANVDKFEGPANTPKADDTWNSYVAWRTKELREVYQGQAQAVYFTICAREWRKRSM